MRDKQVLLETRAVGRIDERRGQVAETGGQAVDDFAGGHKPLHDVARFHDPSPGFVTERHPAPAARNGLHVGDRQIRAGQDKFGVVRERPPQKVGLRQVPVGS
jgi:hypothetical protein